MLESIGFKASPETLAKINELFAFYGLKSENKSDQWRKFIDELHRKLVLYRMSHAEGDAESEQKPNNDEILCNLRISVEKPPKRSKDRVKGKLYSPSGYACVDKPPKATPLQSLEICKVCLALFRGLNIKTKRLAEQVKPAETKTKSRLAYDSYREKQAARLASGEFRRHCRIEQKTFTLLELPCVKATNQDPDKRLGCRFAKCETAVNASLRAYLSMRPSQGDQKT